MGSVPEPPEAVCGNHICEDTEDKENCPDDCVVCEVHEPPECPDGKIVWKGKDEFGCHLPPICVVAEQTCTVDDDCPKSNCGIPKCEEGVCKVKELTTDCDEGCKEGKERRNKRKEEGERTLTRQGAIAAARGRLGCDR